MKEKKSLPPGISLRKDGRYQGRFTMNGKRYTLYDKDLKILKKKLADAKYEMEHGIHGIISNITLNSWFEIWLKEYKMISVKPSTILLYQLNYDRYVKDAIGGHQLHNVRTIHLQKMYHDLLSSGLSIGTIHIIHSILYNLFGQAIKNDIILKNPCKGVMIPKEEKKRPRVLTASEQQLFLQIIKGNYYRPLYIVALATGLRIGELAALSWDDVDLSSRTLTVRQTLLYQKDMASGKFCFRYQTPKSLTSRRIVPLLPDVAGVLADHKQSQALLRCDQKNLWNPFPGMDNLIFTTKRGTPIQECYMIKRLERITRKMNEYEQVIACSKRTLPVIHDRITPHTLRHSFATRAFENGLAPKTVQELLGHSTLTLTMDLYTHVTDDIKVREMNKLSGVFQL